MKKESEKSLLLSRKKINKNTLWSQQVQCLLRKNFLLKRNFWKSAIFELLAPVFVMAALAALKTQVNKTDYKAAHYTNLEAPIGSLEFISQYANQTNQIAALFPDTLLVRNFGNSLENDFPLFQNQIRYMKDDASFTSYCKSASYGNDENPRAVMGLNFQSLIPPMFSYTIRLNSSRSSGRGIPSPSTPRTNGPTIFPLEVKYVENFWKAYVNQGFTAIQTYVDQYIISTQNNETMATSTSFTVIPFPVPAHVEDPFADYVSQFIGFLLTLAFLWPVTQIVKVFVEEKQTRIRETMSIMGLKESARLFSWTVTYSIIFLLQAILIYIVTSTSVYQKSNGFLVIIFYWFFGLSVISLCYFFSTLFNKALTAAICAAIFFVGLYFPSLAFNDNTSESLKNLSCLSPTVCLGLAGYTVAQLESAQLGLSFSTLSQTVDNFKFQTAIFMLFVDFILYMLLGCYLDAVLPKQYGVRRKLLFFLDKKYYLGTVDKTVVSELQECQPSSYQKKNIENVAAMYLDHAVIQIRNLRKEFPSVVDSKKKTIAVNDIYLDMYEGQILALLGHNGAGKTTTINMLTGLYPPTSGNAIISNMTITNNLPLIRKITGVCPQDNRLYDYLTVKEHLKLYGCIKGVSKSSLLHEVEDLLEQVGLTDKAMTQTRALSGGMKRKLSLAMAMIGDSKIVFLDEPTSGMDPYSRRSTWDLLKKMKKNRVIILTTHFMDEADYLGDRIAIMDKGEIKCCGTSLYLKGKYGVGYTMTISKTPAFDERSVKKLVNKCICDASITNAHGQLVQEADILSNIAGEIIFRLQFQAASHFYDLFREFDERQQQLGIANYGISVTTLEEVFLKVGRGDEIDPVRRSQSVNLEEKHGQYNLNTDQEKLMLNSEIVRPVGYDKFKKHVRALLIKRWHHQKRSKKAWLWTIFYPFLIMVAGMGLTKLGGAASSDPILLMDPNQYPNPNIVPYNYNLTISTEEYLGGIQSENLFLQSTNTNSSISMSNYLLQSWTSQKMSRYGAYYIQQIDEIKKVVVFANTSGFHSVPIYINLFNNAKLRNLTANNELEIKCSSAPFPVNAELQTYMDSSISLVLAIAYAFIPASFASFVVLEREINVKHQQLISGVSLSAYWISSFIWDMCNYVIPMLLTLFVVWIYDITQLLGDGLAPLFLATLLYGLSVTSFTYLVQFLFKNHTTAQNSVLFICIISGWGFLIASLVMDIIPSTQDANKYLKYIYRLFPSYAFAETVANLVLKTLSTQYGPAEDQWSMEVVGTNFIFMGLEFIIYFFMALGIEKILSTPRLLVKFQNPNLKHIHVGLDEEDNDVKEERKRAQYCDANAEMIVLRNLRKIYPGKQKNPPKIAVRDLSFGIPAGQCFGFLGINGAGKSSTLKMLTADILPTSGTAYLKGMNLLSEQEKVRSHIGYCPQFDAILPTLTAKETLSMYARIKGVKENDIGQFVEQMVNMMGLTDFADEPCGGYSGGNKRKLSVGMALIGNPSIVFLDEPSTGMDPESRRFMWQVIEMSMKNRSVILTTHSMEECEALCSRIGIIVNGSLRCIGSSQHLKSIYGDGFQLDINVQSKEAQAFEIDSAQEAEEKLVRNLKKFMNDSFKEPVFLERQGGNLKYRIRTKECFTLGNLFKLMEDNREQLQIEEYSISDTSLEQIFIYFASQQ